MHNAMAFIQRVMVGFWEIKETLPSLDIISVVCVVITLLCVVPSVDMASSPTRVVASFVTEIEFKNLKDAKNQTI